ncbi:MULTISPECIES: hypothetical protein [unclassified Streptomyces]|uniref:hypothetical protein n=1 Tax=unclassified Streptomyces TaxID=2593676 RepID=UPI0005602E43|nr:MULTISPECIES: hypothetical protein [unclassified Streptomyces]MYT28111.1 DUF1648 domain-containing protein [Streptomyces sp. SID8354]
MKQSGASAPPAGTRRRGWLAAAPFIVVTLTLGALYACVAGRLPDRLASGFGLDGRPNGYSSPQAFLVVCLVVLLVLGAGIGLFIRHRTPVWGGRVLVGTGWFTAVTLGAPVAAILLGNAGAAGPGAVRLPAWLLAATLAAGAAAGVLAWLLAGPDAPAPRTGTGAAGRLDLPAGVRAGWSRTVSSLPLALVGGLLTAVGILQIVLGALLGGAVMGLGGALVVGCCSARVTVDRRGLTVQPALLPFPLRRIPLAKVAEATSRSIAALSEYGGWGYRIRPGGSGLLLRSGEGVVLRLTNGREFVVTVDDAATAAALLNTYLDRRRSGEGG